MSQKIGPYILAKPASAAEAGVLPTAAAIVETSKPAQRRTKEYIVLRLSTTNLSAATETRRRGVGTVSAETSTAFLSSAPCVHRGTGRPLQKQSFGIMAC